MKLVSLHLLSNLHFLRYVVLHLLRSHTQLLLSVFNEPALMYSSFLRGENTHTEFRAPTQPAVPDADQLHVSNVDEGRSFLCVGEGKKS